MSANGIPNEATAMEWVAAVREIFFLGPDEAYARLRQLPKAKLVEFGFGALCLLDAIHDQAHEMAEKVETLERRATVDDDVRRRALGGDA